MFPFSGESPKLSEPEVVPGDEAPKAVEPHPLDTLTGGVFSAATSGERSQRLRDWLATDPDPVSMQKVYKELSTKDKGAAKPLRDRLDELRRAKAQDAMVAQWQEKAQTLLDTERLNIADGLAWERDAAAAGAPLSREPLAGLRVQLNRRVQALEDIQQRVMVQVEAAALLTQRIELLSTKSWSDAVQARSALENDLAHWNRQAAAIVAEPSWQGIDLRYPPQLESAQAQLHAVWPAFVSALQLAVAAAEDAKAPLPPVQVWADELRAAREKSTAKRAPDQGRTAQEEQKRETAAQVVQAGTKLLEHAVASGNTKDVNSARQALRRALKTHGNWIDDALEARVHAALVSAGELQGWQRWSADKVRQQLIARAEGLLRKRKVASDGDTQAEQPATPRPDAAQVEGEPAPTPEGEVVLSPAVAQPQAPAGDSAEVDAEAPTVIAAAAGMAGPAASEMEAEQGEAPESAVPASEASPDEFRPLEAGYAWEPTLTGRKLQDALRKLRDEWKTADIGGAPNHALWQQFDRACNTAHQFVVQWLEKARAEEQKNEADRRALIQQLNDWAAAHPGGADTNWKNMGRDLRKFAQRWRNSGHVSEKVYQTLQQQWKAAMAAASMPLEREQKASRARRQELIAQAQALGAEPRLRIDAIKALQASWQAEARAVPLNRKREQKLWDAFRKPLDDAFKRKDAEREQRRAASNAHDQAVLAAARILEQANASGDAARIREAMAALEAATRAPAGQAETMGTGKQVEPTPTAGAASKAAEEAGPDSAETPAADAAIPEASDAAAPDASNATDAAREQRVVAVRGDDRPDADKPQAARRDQRRDRDEARHSPRQRRDGYRGNDRRARDERDSRGPAIGRAARRAQQQAVEKAETALRQLAARAHGEALVELLSAWQNKDASQVPQARDFGRAVTPSVCNDWKQAISEAGGSAEQASKALLRLEVAAETPSPADQVEARRALKLQLLTQRNDPAPLETWPQDVLAVLASAHDAGKSERLQKAMKILLHKR